MATASDKDQWRDGCHALYLDRTQLLPAERDRLELQRTQLDPRPLSERLVDYWRRQREVEALFRRRG